MQIMGQFPGTENWFYVDDRDVAFMQSGRYPRHARGHRRRPARTDGDGRGDWQDFDPARLHVQRTIPASRRPRAVNPSDGFIISWNNKEALGWRKGPTEWSQRPRPPREILQKRLFDRGASAAAARST